MSKILFLFTFLILFSCSKQELSTYQEMKSDKLMSECFTENELKDLAKVVDFFEQEMSKEIDSTLSIESKYKAFLKKDSTVYVNGEMQEFINYDLQKNVYKSMDTSFFNNLWDVGKTTFYDEKRNEVNVEYYHLKTFDSKYSSFLKRLSAFNPYIEKYYENIGLSNDFHTPSTPTILTFYHNKLDKADIKNRLIYALHFLNINEEYIRHQKFINENTNTHY